MHAVQQGLSEIPTGAQLLVEVYHSTGDEVPGPVEAAGRGRSRRTAPRGVEPATHWFFHSLIGRSANDALARVVAQRWSRLRGGNAVATPDDYGFVLTLAAAQELDGPSLSALLRPEGFEEDLRHSLRRSELLKYHFRNAAQTGLMVYRNYFGEQKSVRKLQWSAEVIFNVLAEHEPDHVLMREAYRDTIHSFLDVDGARAFLDGAASLPRVVREVSRVPPLSFGMYVSRIREALLVEDPRETMERLFHLWWSRLEHPQPEAQPGSASA